MPATSRKKIKGDLEPLWESEARTNAKREQRAPILEAASKAFMTRGYVGTTLDDVAKLLGTTKGQIYHYYRSKTDLYFDVAVGSLFMVHERIKDIFEMEQMPALDKLRNVIYTYALELMENFAFHRVALEATQFQMIGRQSMSQERAQNRIVALRTRLENKVGRLIAEAAPHSLAGEGNAILVKAAFGSLTWLVVWFDPGRQTSQETIERIARATADFVVDGLRGASC